MAKDISGTDSRSIWAVRMRNDRSLSTTLSESPAIPRGRGYGRFHYQENIQFCRQARGSLFELVDHLTVAYDEEYISEKKLVELKERVFEIIRMLNGYIKYLKGRKGDLVQS